MLEDGTPLRPHRICTVFVRQVNTKEDHDLLALSLTTPLWVPSVTKVTHMRATLPRPASLESIYCVVVYTTLASSDRSTFTHTHKPGTITRHDDMNGSAPHTIRATATSAGALPFCTHHILPNCTPAPAMWVLKPLIVVFVLTLAVVGAVVTLHWFVRRRALVNVPRSTPSV